MGTDKKPEETVEEYIARKLQENREKFFKELEKKILEEVRKKLKPETTEPEE